MSKEIKDTLPLYYGQKCQLCSLNYDGQTFEIDGPMIALLSMPEVKIIPILRSLEDITEEECEEYNRIHLTCHSINKIQDQIRTEASATQYLLSKGFDLFGLIIQGLAIDKTTI